MTTEQWTNIGTIIGIIVGFIAIISALIGFLKWLWKKFFSKRKDKLSKEELECIREFDEEDAPLEWSEGMEKKNLKICESLVKKQYLEEWSSSPSRAMVLFGLTDLGKEIYKKAMLDSNANIIKAMKAANRIFPEKIASVSNAPESEVRKIIKLLEDEGRLLPLKSDNRGALFWTWKK